jgi:Zn-dependent peptidase ImmA (M78 family)/transcriptional regulator with XRE-family HTH domain
MDIGSRLRFAREAIGYTLDKAEKESGIGASSISEFENEKREPKFSQLSRLAEVYKRGIDFFLTDRPLADPVMLWRDGPNNQEEMKETESEFRRLCQQYHKLELCTKEACKATLPVPDITNSEDFNFHQAESFAGKVQSELGLGDIPSASLKKILEERCYVKVFYLEFTGSAISTVSDEFGPAILLNSRNVSWRRNYDLAHELFHLLTWSIFRTRQIEPNENEEKLADSFASKLLMPEKPLRQRITALIDKQEQAPLDRLDDLAREFGVSLDALFYRVASLYRIKKQDSQKFLAATKQLAKTRKAREPDNPETLPERYCDLAVRALRGGRLSLMQFAKYMGISYKRAQEYLTDDEDFTDEKISIPVA